MTQPGSMSVHGGCHCGAVGYQVTLPHDVQAHACNCSICASNGYIGIIVKQSDFLLEHGHDLLTEYTFNTRVARHFFCSACGVKSFYHPRSNPDGVSVNLNCLALHDGQSIAVVPFNGQEWELHAHTLRHLSQP